MHTETSVWLLWILCFSLFTLLLRDFPRPFCQHPGDPCISPSGWRKEAWFISLVQPQTMRWDFVPQLSLWKPLCEILYVWGSKELWNMGQGFKIQPIGTCREVLFSEKGELKKALIVSSTTVSTYFSKAGSDRRFSRFLHTFEDGVVKIAFL